jgi:hypothetical protein
VGGEVVTLLEIDPSPWASWAQIVAVTVSILGGVWTFDRRMQRRLDAQDAEAKSLRERLDRELGGNGGGLREAVNTLKDGQAELREAQRVHLTFHAEHP